MAKLYYSIKEVSEEIDEEQHVLRYWEKEFSVLKPKKNKAGNRTYSHKDLIILKKIKDLIREQRIPVKEVKDILKKINWNLEKDLVVSNNEVVEVNVNLEKNILVDIDESVNKEKESKQLESKEQDKEVENDINEEFHIEDLDKSQENIDEQITEIVVPNFEQVVDTFESAKDKSEDSNVDKLFEIQEIEKSLNFEIDKKIILKNHLFEDYEEFSIIPAEFINNDKERIEKEKLEKDKIDKEKSDKNNKLNQSNIDINDEDGIYLSNEKLGILIDILKEIRKII